MALVLEAAKRVGGVGPTDPLQQFSILKDITSAMEQNTWNVLKPVIPKETISPTDHLWKMLVYRLIIFKVDPGSRKNIGHLSCLSLTTIPQARWPNGG